MTRRPQKQQGMSTGARTGLIVGGVVAVALIALIIATFSAGDGADDASQFAPVSFAGEALPLFPEEGADPAIGLTMPDLVGQDFDGNAVSITNDGRPKVLLFLAHW